MSKTTVRDITQIAIVAALYVIFTVAPPFNMISYGAYQFRVSEMLNLLGFYNKKYIIAVTLGCFIANVFSGNWVDVFVGSASTLVFVWSGVVLFEKYKTEEIFGGLFIKAHFYFALYFSFFMLTIAAEISIMSQLPFLYTWFTVALGELASLLVGALLVKRLSKVVDFNS